MSNECCFSSGHAERLCGIAVVVAVCRGVPRSRCGDAVILVWAFYSLHAVPSSTVLYTVQYSAVIMSTACCVTQHFRRATRTDADVCVMYFTGEGRNGHIQFAAAVSQWLLLDNRECVLHWSTYWHILEVSSRVTHAQQMFGWAVQAARMNDEHQHDVIRATDSHDIDTPVQGRR